ncbi:AAA family ATPase [Amycolatopsis sp. NPDC051071]|uniref:helix-turn-helix transcriptional regulator n=1 Tax=Amycolatopsis sp. NPDC051071 TaxID=3154637 RepID=UPI0034271F9C
MSFVNALLERAQPMAALRSKLDENTKKIRGSTVVLTGPPGSGKTTLLQDFAYQAAVSGAVVLSAVGAKLVQDVPFGMIRQLCDGMAMPELEEVTRLTGHSGEIDSEGATANVAYDICARLLQVSACTPLLISIDDVQFADEASTLCLQLLDGRLHTAQIMLVVAESPHERGRKTDWLRQPRSLRLKVPLLSPSAVEQLVTARYPDPEFAAACLRVTGGNPLLLNVLLGEEQPGTEPIGRSPGYRQAVTAVLGRYGAVTVAVARAMAVLTESAAPALVADLLGLDEKIVKARVQELEQVGLAAGDRLRDEAICAAVLDEMPVDELGRMNLQAAELLYHDAARPDRIAKLLLDAQDAEEPWIVGILTEAAAEISTPEAADFARRCLDMARRICVDDRQRADIAVRRAAIEWQQPTFKITRHTRQIGDMVDDLRAGAHRSVTLIHYLLRYGQFGEAARAVSALASAGQTPDAAELAALRLMLAATYPPLAKALRPSAADEESGDAWLALHAGATGRSATMLYDVLTQRIDGNPLVGAGQLLRTVRLDSSSFEQVESILLALVYADELATAASACEHMLVRARHVGSAAWQARLHSLFAEIALRQGDPKRSLEHAELSLRLLPRQAWGVAIGLSLSCLILASTRLGRYQAAADHVHQLVPDDLLKTRFGLHYLYARGEYHLATSQLHAALEDFMACGDLMREWAIDSPGLLPWRTGVTRVYAAIGEHDRAVQMVDAQAERLRPGQSRGRGITLRYRAAVSEPKNRPRLLRQAVECLQNGQDQHELAHAYADLGRAYQVLGDHQRSRMMFRQSVQLADARGFAPLKERLAKEFPNGARGEAEAKLGAVMPKVLSESERKVAFLASHGYTNREISEKLFVTMSTVEQHLTRIYRKLKVAGRHDLPARLGGAVARGG